MVMEEESRTPRSPEAKLGKEVEDLWDVQESQLSPTEKLNACFESIPVSEFPHAPPSQVIEIKSDASLSEAVRLLSQNKILSAPVVNVDAPEDASWIDRYLGMVEFAGIVVWTLHQSEKNDTLDEPNLFSSALEDSMGPAVVAAATGMSSPRYRSSQPGSPKTAGNFFELLTSSDLYKNTKVKDISGSFRWAPFLALQTSNSFLTMLLLLSKYRMKSVPVVDPGEQKIDNIITQSAVIHMLEECADLQWFKSWGSKQLCELGLPLMNANQVIKVNEDEPVLQAFRLMRQKGIGGLPVVSDGNKPVANISIRDIQFLLIAPEIYKDYRSITAKNFVTSVKRYLEENQKSSPLVSGMITCRKNETLEEVISKLDSKEIHRIYVVDEEGNLEGVITLRDIISRIVHEPRGYFGDFFDGVLPLPANSRV
ncbi:SNF1-related protein kinase regulatory subunit gamma-1-like [Cynara cardunculus var. scolymus]|uniref:SNF1-related protein kinase regulatory subunit gamma-1-like n=1 Tax=Cynara cardunculus var. scolymus TaxID=59895 RepID=UPI000D6257E6|nr:SNF1-related protein kinase regulatory subunit gamma-1-like [Cynara cardunculus var. scolymus]